MNLGKLGVWASLDALSANDAAAFARRLEARGFETLWMPESRGRNVLVNAAWILANTTRLNIATGIANIYARDAFSANAALQGLNEQSGGRFMLGLGVSHKPMVSAMRGHDYGKPVPTMRAYLKAMQEASYAAPAPKEKPKIVIAALGPLMLKLAAEIADGAHPYCVTPEHTAEARKVLGRGKILAPEQMVMLETDPARARTGARVALAPYIAMENYCANWRRLGFNQSDFADGGSDRLIDANNVWGDEAAIRQRIQAHWDAGADHVCIQSI
ncbi:MAG: TIGR03620 family F420-dependent LLM class oxidoreductase, partial [Hyphomicrobiaceae bacterium]